MREVLKDFQAEDQLKASPPELKRGDVRAEKFDIRVQPRSRLQGLPARSTPTYLCPLLPPRWRRK